MNFPLNILSDSFNNPFVTCILLSTLSTLFCSLIPHLQYKYKLISKITSDDYGKGADFLAFILINIGTLRNYAFIESVWINKSLELDSYLNKIFMVIGVLLIISGSILLLTSFHKLGLRGMYYGDHFGFLLEKRIKAFPYNYLENPQYSGLNMCYFGFTLANRSPIGLIITIYILICNQFVFLFNEKKKLKVFYPKTERVE